MALYNVQDRYGEVSAYIEADIAPTGEEVWDVHERYTQYANALHNERREARRRAERAGVIPIIEDQRPDERIRDWQARIAPAEEIRREWDLGVGAQFKPKAFRDWLKEHRPDWKQIEVVHIIAERPRQQEDDEPFDEDDE